jgi:hypothetical protein
MVGGVWDVASCRVASVSCCLCITVKGCTSASQAVRVCMLSINAAEVSLKSPCARGHPSCPFSDLPSFGHLSDSPFKGEQPRHATQDRMIIPYCETSGHTSTVYTQRVTLPSAGCWGAGRDATDEQAAPCWSGPGFYQVRSDTYVCRYSLR